MLDELLGEARAAWAAEEWVRSAEAYERLLALVPDDPRAYAWWFDAALAYKFVRDWRKAYELGVQAAARAERGTGDPAFWNLGIAATVLREWDTARDAWLGYGVRLPDGTGQIDADLGLICVRLNVDNGQEVVWARRLCPTRARVLNVPFSLERRFGEVVVHDGVPTGDRVSGGTTYRVFDEITLFEPSPLPTLSVTVSAATPDDLDALAELVDAQGYGFEPLAGGVLLCACCSKGTVESEREPLSGEQHALVAAPMDRAEALLTTWCEGNRPGRGWADLHPAI